MLQVEKKMKKKKKDIASKCPVPTPFPPSLPFLILSDHKVNFCLLDMQKCSNEICEWSHHIHITVIFISF